jgi:alanyl aminopeptidase
LLQRLEDYFGSPYPYDKLDQIVVPITTAWGCDGERRLIAYSDQYLLAKPSEDILPRQKARASVQAHEMAHQWVRQPGHDEVVG